MIKPLHDQVLIQLEGKDNVTESGIILARTENDTEPDKGTVLAIGPGRINHDGSKFPVSVSRGDRVMFARYAGHVIKEEGREFILVGEKDIIAVIGDDEN